MISRADTGRLCRLVVDSLLCVGLELLNSARTRAALSGTVMASTSTGDGYMRRRFFVVVILFALMADGSSLCVDIMRVCSFPSRGFPIAATRRCADFGWLNAFARHSCCRTFAVCRL